MVPNNAVLMSAVVPLREPASVDLRARLRPDVRPSDLQALLQENVQTPVRAEPHISLEEVDRDEVIVRVAATPLSESDGPQLADEILAAIGAVTRDGDDDDGDHDRDSEGTAARAPLDRDRYRRDDNTQEYES